MVCNRDCLSCCHGRYSFGVEDFDRSPFYVEAADDSMTAFGIGRFDPLCPFLFNVAGRKQSLDLLLLDSDNVFEPGDLGLC